VRSLTSRDNLFTVANDNAGNASRRSETSLAKRRESAFFIFCHRFRKLTWFGLADTDVRMGIVACACAPRALGQTAGVGLTTRAALDKL
jgi:hypothetical protein